MVPGKWDHFETQRKVVVERCSTQVVLAATKSDGHAFQYAAGNLRSDFDTVAMATLPELTDNSKL